MHLIHGLEYLLYSWRVSVCHARCFLHPHHRFTHIPVLCPCVHLSTVVIQIVPSSALPDLLLDLFNGSYPLSAIAEGVADGIGGILAFLLSPMFGEWADLHGRKTVLIGLTALSFLPILALSFYPYLSLWAYLSVRGLNKFGAFGLFYSCISDVVDIDKRSRLYSQVTGTVMLAMCVGPSISLLFSAVWSFRVSGIASFVTLLYVIFIMPETREYGIRRRERAEREKAVESSQSSSSSDMLLSSNSDYTALLDPSIVVVSSTADVNGDRRNGDIQQAHSSIHSSTYRFSPFSSLLQSFRPSTRRIAFIILLSQLTQNGVKEVVQLYLKDVYHFTRDDNSELLLVMGGWAVSLMVLILPLLQYRYNLQLKYVLAGAMAMDVLHMSTYLWMPNKHWFWFICFFQGLGYLSLPLTNYYLSSIVQEDVQGSMLNMSGGIRSFTQGLAPAIFSSLFAYFTWDRAFMHAPQVPFVLGAIFVSIAVVLTLLAPTPVPVATASDSTCSAERLNNQVKNGRDGGE